MLMEQTFSNRISMSMHFRPYLLTVIDHGDFKELHPVTLVLDKDILLLGTVCKDLPLCQLPRKRCGFNTDHTYLFPDVLLVGVVLYNYYMIYKAIFSELL